MLGRSLLPASVAALAVCGAASAVLVGASVGPRPGKEAAARPATPAAVATFLFSGHGWGHGVGMSQWGARGYALHGWSFDRILAHYYPGTKIGTAPVEKVRVLLASGEKKLALASTGAWAVVDGAGVSHPLAPGRLTLGLDLAPAGGAPLPPPLSFVPQSVPLSLAGKGYRGTIQVSLGASGKLQAVDVVGLEDYLRGVVPAEMPSTWPVEALKAQAVAARSYALAQRATSKPYDLFSDVRSQIYRGVAGESVAASAAIDATAGQVLLYDGKVADTLFFSSSGGRTAALSEGFPDAKPVPYLVSVADPYDGSPDRDWGPVAITGAGIGKALKLASPVVDVAPVLGPSGRVATAALQLRSGKTVVVSGADLRATLGLRSTWLSIGLLSLTPPSPAVVYGSSATVAGLVRGVAVTPTLEQRTPGEPWTPAPTIAPGKDGSFSLTLKPNRTTDFRLVSGTLRGAVARVAVAPGLELRADLTGTAKPAVPGTAVAIQLQQGSKWQTVTTVPVDAGGSFSASGLGPGVYRAVYAPGTGLARAVSAPVEARR